MNYQKHYDLLIEREKARILSGYVEVHHVGKSAKVRTPWNKGLKLK